MSIITDFLKLFKYDPETDGASTFNIKQCLNDNWDKIDAWASGIKSTIAGLVPGTRKVNGKELSADVTLTGEDIKTSASDETTISSQLSNLESSKLNKTLRTGSGQDLNAIIPSSGSIEVYRVFNPSANVPPGYTENSCDFFLIAICEAAQMYVRQYAFDVRSTAIWTRRSYDDSGVIHWQDWKQIVLATPPQEFDLPLADGFDSAGNASIYWKDQFGIVRVYVAVLKNSGTITNNEILGTLPEGFRPKHNFAVVGFGNSNQNNIADRHPINMIISSNGNITASFLSETDGTKIASLYGTAEFLPES